jgi:glycosyltransferase involved in cell wall biosynthesis
MQSNVSALSLPSETSKQPKVSVCVVTYNQEAYIEKCLMSLVEQKANFEYEIIVGEDCSTDGTRAVVERIAKMHPTKIRLILQKKNIGATDNYKSVYSSARGKYIAHMDGDDYALPGKLQAQYDILEAEPECNIVWHKMLIEYSDGRTINGGPMIADDELKEKLFRRADIIQFISIGGNSSKMHRRIDNEMRWPPFDLLDYSANVAQIGTGYAKIIPSIYGAYRSGIGISVSGVKVKHLLGRTFEWLAIEFPEYKAEINAACLTYLVADLVNRRKTALLFARIWLRNFHPLSISKFISGYRFMRSLVVR